MRGLRHGRASSLIKTHAAEDDAAEPRSPLTACTEAVVDLMQAAASGDADTRLDALIEYVPDTLLDRAIDSKKAAG